MTLITKERQSEEFVRRPYNVAAQTWRLLSGYPLAAVGVAILLLIIGSAVFADQIARYPYQQSHVADRLQSPSWTYWLGTDALGRDVFSRMVFGSRIVVTIGFGAVLLGTGIATVIGVVSGYFGGWADTLLQRVIDIWMAFPALILIISLVVIFGTDTKSIAFTIGILLAAQGSRVVRSDVIRVRSMPFVESSVTLGAGHTHIMFRHVLPNVVPIVIVLSTIQLGAAILITASISFLGYGVPDPTPSWGAMLATDGRAAFLQQPLLAVWPGIAITAAVWAANMLGDGLRDALDPRLRQ